MSELPPWIQTQLAAQGIDLDAAGYALLDAQDQWLIFETGQALDASDRNGVSDIYRLDLLTETLALLSRNLQGAAGNGPSSYPAADTFGEWVVFQSDADDLVEDDGNGVTDIFLHDVALGLTTRITASAVQASAHPALDAAGESLLYDQLSFDGNRHIFADTLWGDTPGEPISLEENELGILLDNHHPAISADGRFVAYLEESAVDVEQACQVHIYDRESGLYQRHTCPDQLTSAGEAVWPQFSADGLEVRWYMPELDDPVVILNFLPGTRSGAVP